jgi:hypothetical protein
MRLITKASRIKAVTRHSPKFRAGDPSKDDRRDTSPSDLTPWIRPAEKRHRLKAGGDDPYRGSNKYGFDKYPNFFIQDKPIGSPVSRSLIYANC